MKFDLNSEKPVLGTQETPLESYPLRQRFVPWLDLSNDTLRSKIDLLVQKLLIYAI